MASTSEYDQLQTVLDVVGGVTLTVQVLLLAAYCRQLQRFPIKQRFPKLTVAYSVVLICLCPSWFLIEPFGCLPWYSLNLPGLVLAGLLVFFRLFALLVYLEVQRDVMLHEELRANRQKQYTAGSGGGATSPTQSPLLTRNAAAGSDDTGPMLVEFHASWFTRHRHWLTQRNVVLSTVTVVAICAAIFFSGISLVLDRPHETCGLSPQSEEFALRCFYSLVGMGGMVGVLLLGTVYRLAQHKADGYGIKQEFKAMLVVVVIEVVLQLVMKATVTANDGKLNAYVSGLLLMLLQLGTAVTGVGFPLYLCWRHERLQRQTAAEMQSALKVAAFLTIPGGFQCFLEFCAAEFNSELLLFWKACQDLAREPLPSNSNKSETTQASSVSPPGARASVNTQVPTTAADCTAALREAQSIAATFICVGSPSELNIGSELRQRCLQQLERLAAQCQQLVSGAPQSPSAITLDVTAVAAPSDAASLLSQIRHAFDEIQTDVLDLLQSNSFMRFRLSPLFQSLAGDSRAWASAQDGAVYYKLSQAGRPPSPGLSFLSHSLPEASVGSAAAGFPSRSVHPDSQHRAASRPVWREGGAVAEVAPTAAGLSLSPSSARVAWDRQASQ